MILRIVFIVFVSWQLSSCCPGKQNKSVEYKPDNEFSLNNYPEDLQKFLSEFEKASLAHSKEMLLKSMDAHYKAEQHDNFLQGRTDQFLNEFFCGNRTEGKEEFTCIKYSEITEIKLSDISKNESGYNITYLITGNSFSIKCNWTVTITIGGDLLIYGLCGAVG